MSFAYCDVMFSKKSEILFTSTSLLACNLSAYIAPSRSSAAAVPPALLLLQMAYVVAADIWPDENASTEQQDSCSTPDTAPCEANRRYACVSDSKALDQ